MRGAPVSRGGKRVVPSFPNAPQRAAPNARQRRLSLVLPKSPPTLFGHPAGLFTLFFAEMWERFSYYGMRALLLFYMIKGFLGYGDTDAYAVYGAYTALVYLTPFFGGMLADRLLGARRAVVLGGLLMAAGHLLMTIENQTAFFTALALLICGNGFFKPNISTMVGSLYPPGGAKRDAGFTLFYMGINLGAAMSPLLCGYIGETYGWHYGFGLATVGMLTGLAVFALPRRVAQVLILGAALIAAGGLFVFRPDSVLLIAVNALVGVALLVAGSCAWIALRRGGLPSAVGAPPDIARLRRRAIGPLSREWAVYLATLLAVPVVVLFVSGFAPLAPSGEAAVLMSSALLERLRGGGAFAQVLAVVAAEMSRPAGLALVVSGVAALGYLVAQTVKLDKIPRERMFVVLVLTFFSLAFWAFFEQAGSSVNNFTDRNVDRVRQARVVTAAEVGSRIRLQPTQEQLGYRNGASPFTLDDLNALREAHRDDPHFTISWRVAEDNVGMGLASRDAETPASVFQALNPIYILVFGLAFTALWGFLGSRGWEPATPSKFALGLVQLGLGFGAFFLGAQFADERGMVAAGWLALGYLLHTSGELCLSPVGLAMVTRLSPARLVSTVMGAWFLATAFSQFAAAIIAQFTGVVGAEDAAVPPPIDTLDIYAGVFGNIAVLAVVLGGVCWALSPLLKRWMHEDATPSSSTGQAREGECCAR